MARRLAALLVHMPMANPALPNLAIEQLAEIARRRGVTCDVLYGSLLLPASVPADLVYGMAGPSLFSQDYYDRDADEFAEQLVGCLGAETGGANWTNLMREARIGELLLAIDGAQVCLERCTTAIPKSTFDVVAFSVSFDAQKMPSAALAKRLKRREPDLKILFGGTGCDGQMAGALLDAFPEIDAVATGEGEEIFVPAMYALCGQVSMETVPQIVYRQGNVIQETDTKPPFDELDDLPKPEYGAFLEQRANSAYQDLELTLMFESSRGCWWGRKHHCEFCGIRAVRLGHRSRSVRSTLETVRHLRDSYKPDILYSTDAILPLPHLKEMMPVLAKERKTKGQTDKLFYEIKSNMRREDIAMLAAAGVVYLQPGIESLSTNVLRRLKKGTTALQQIEWLKWATSYKLVPIYGILVGTPGETTEELDDMRLAMRMLRHLTPPVGMNALGLHRFSPYANNAEALGFCNVSPFPIQRLTYDVDDEVLMRLCYEFNYRLPEHETERYERARCKLAKEIVVWQNDYTAGSKLVMSDLGASIVIVRRNANQQVSVQRLRGLQAQVYRNSQETTTISSLAHALRQDQGRVASIVAGLAEQQLMATCDDHCLAVATIADADAWVDAGLVEFEVRANPSLAPQTSA